jgi:Outer membrane protein beta-barrel domain
MRIGTRGLTGAAAVLAVGLAVPALAEGPRYTYGELGYQRVDIDNYSGDGDFGFAGGSIGLNDRLYLFGSYSDGSVDGPGNSDVDITTAAAGLGVHFPLNDTVDFVVDGAYVWSEVDSDFFNSQDEDGYAVRAGLRAMLTPKFELNGGASYVDVTDDDTSAFVGAVYNFTDVFAVTGGADIGDNATTYSVGLRLYFNMR